MDEHIPHNEQRLKIHPCNASNDISVSLASLLKSFSQSSVVGDHCDLPAITSELSVDIETFERNLLTHKQESFLTQLSNGDRVQNIEYINDKRFKSHTDNNINKSIRDENKLSSRFINSRLSSNIESLNSIQMNNMTALKSLLNNQNGQIYLLVKGDTVQTLDGTSNVTGLFDTNNYSHNIQLSSDLGEDLSSSESCTTINNPSLIMAAKQLHMSNNISTVELIQKLLESPQTSCPNSQVESIIGDHKLSDDSLPSMSNYQRHVIQGTDNITNYYTCSIDSNNEADVTLLVDEENSESNSQFTTNNRSLKNDKQIFVLNSNIKLESRPSTTDDLIDNSVKNHFNSLLNDHRTDNLSINNDIYDDLSHNFIPSNTISSFNNNSSSMTASTSNKNTNICKRHKRIKTKPLKNVEINDFAECGSKSYSPNSPMFSMSVSQLEDNSPKESVTGNGEIKELKRKSSHNEVERRRRDRINTWIGELQNMLPNSEKMQLNRSKSHILKAVYDFFRGQTDQFNDLKIKHEKLENENQEKNAIIKKLETEKEVLLNHLQYINQAVTSTVKSTQESLNRSTVNQYRVNPIDKVSQPYRITNIYSNSNEINSFPNGYVTDNNQSKKRKINETDNDQ